MSEECLKNAQDLTKSQKHDPITDSPTWIQEMLAHLKTIYSTQGGSNSTSHNMTHNTTPSNTMQHTLKHNEAMCLMV